MKIFITLILFSTAINLYPQYQFDIIQQNAQGFAYASDFATFNNHLFFCTSDSTYGNELFISDGTVQGTMFFKDINPIGDANPDFLTVCNDRLFFTADDGSSGIEIWVTDGTVGGTLLLLDINPSGSSEPKDLTACGDKLFFSADDGKHGRELWISDGTATGTHMLLDIYPGGYGSPICFMPLSNKLVFSASDNHGYKLWVTDGSIQGTFIIKNIWPYIYNYSNYYVLYHDKVYFTAHDAIYGQELWVSDGSSSGTYLVKDINPKVYLDSPGSSYPDQFAIFQDKIFFSAIDGTHNEELWVSDGTPDGTKLVKDINPSGGSNPICLTNYNDRLYFSADDGINGAEIWVTDGTPGQTQLLKDIDPSGGSHPYALTVNCGKLFFRGEASLFVSDGTENGTFYIEPKTATNGHPLSSCYQLYSFQNKLFFNAAFTSSDLSLWMLTDSASMDIDEEVQVNDLLIYPNPANEKIFIKSEEQITAIRITNLKGELIYHWNGNSKYIIINLKEEISGIYLMSFFNGPHKYGFRKFIKID